MASTPIDVVAVREPVVNIGARPKYGVVEGPQTVTWQQYPASNVSSGGFSINAGQPNRTTLIDRRVYLQMTCTFTFTGTCPGGNIPLLDIGVSDSLRAFPIASVTNSQSMNIGGAAATVGGFDQYFPYMMRFNNKQEQTDFDLGVTPSFLDSYPEYSQGLGSNRNPLGGYGDNGFELLRGGATDAQIVPGSYVPYAPASPGTGSSHFDIVLQEPLFLSPFIWARTDKEPGFIGIDTFNYQITFDALSRMWSRYNVPGGSFVNGTTGLVVTILSASLNFRQMTLTSISPIPKQMAYSYFAPTNYPTQGIAVAAGATATISSSNIQLPGVPRRIYIWASESLGTRNMLGTDTAFGLESVNFQWGTDTYLSTANSVDLYNISVKNGYSSPGGFTAWSRYTGGILCLEPGSDIGLPATVSAGSEGKFQITVRVGVRNLSATRSITPQLNFVAVQEGLFEIVDGVTSLKQNPVGPRDVLEAVKMQGVEYKSSESVYGGNFFTDLLKGVNSVSKFVAPLAKFVPGPYGQIASQGLDLATHLTGGKRVTGVRGGRRQMMRGRGLDSEPVFESKQPVFRETKREGKSEEKPGMQPHEIARAKMLESLGGGGYGTLSGKGTSSSSSSSSRPTKEPEYEDYEDYEEEDDEGDIDPVSAYLARRA